MEAGRIRQIEKGRGSLQAAVKNTAGCRRRKAFASRHANSRDAQTLSQSRRGWESLHPSKDNHRAVAPASPTHTSVCVQRDQPGEHFTPDKNQRTALNTNGTTLLGRAGFPP